MIWLKSFFLQYAFEITGFVLLGFCLAAHVFPEGYIVLGGDVLQPINMSMQFFHMHYDEWWLGRVSLFYSLFYLLDTIGISNTGQLYWYLGIFLFGGYCSFLYFCSLIFRGMARWVVTLAALFYATNIYTLYIFTSTWGFTHYQILYVFIPVLTGLYIRAVCSEKYRFAAFFLIMFVLSSSGFGNPAFFVSSGIYFLLLTAFMVLWKVVKFDIFLIKKCLYIALGVIILNMYWILPLTPRVNGGLEEVRDSTDLHLSEVLSDTSNTVFDTIRLMQTHEQDIYYPDNFPYQSLSWMKKEIALVAFFPFFLVLIGMRLLRRESHDYRLAGLFFSVFIFFVALVARVRFPFDGINAILFNLPGVNVLRGYDKTAIFTPFLLSALFALALTSLSFDTLKKRVAVFGGMVCIVILLALPFYLGGIQTKMSYILRGKKDFREAKYSSLINIPQEYYAVARIINQENADEKIAVIPYSPGSSVGRVDLPGLKVNGPDPIRGLSTREYIDLTGENIGGWKFAEDFTVAYYDPRWIIDIYGLLGAKHIIYHKDATQKRLEAFEPVRQYLDRTGSWSVADDNKFLTLYSLDDSRVFPYFYTSKQTLVLQKSLAGLSNTIQNFHKSIQSVSYQKKNPLAISATLDAVSAQALSNSYVFLNEKHDSLWRAEYISSQGNRITLKRADNSTDTMNSWFFEGKAAPGGRVEIYYLPLHLMYIGEIISGVAFLWVLIWIVFPGSGRYVYNFSQRIWKHS